MINAKTSRQFAILAGQLLEVARDAHIWLDADGDRLAGFPAQAFALTRIFESAETNSTSVSDPSIVRWLPGGFQTGPAYLVIGSWAQKAAQDIECRREMD